MSHLLSPQNKYLHICLFMKVPCDAVMICAGKTKSRSAFFFISVCYFGGGRGWFLCASKQDTLSYRLSGFRSCEEEKGVTGSICDGDGMSVCVCVGAGVGVGVCGHRERAG